MSAALRIERPTRAILVLALAAAISASLALGSAVRSPAPDAHERSDELPLSFVANGGQTDARVRYTAQGAGFSFYFTRHKAVMAFTKGKRGVALHLTPQGASPDARLAAGERLPGKVNYLSGAGSHTDLPTYGTLAYRDLWPGIDMVFRGSGGALKYEFHVQPGANPNRIRLAYRGADGVSVGSAGNLLIGTPLGTLRDSRPRSWQIVGGKRVAVGSRYALHGQTGYGFALGSSYDVRRPLVIDPGLTYSTFQGGTVADQGNAIAIDASGNAYVTGQANSANYPATAGAFDTTHGGMTDVFVSKLNAAGSSFTYTTFLGGAGNDVGRGIAVDGSGNAYVTGSAVSGFPTTAGALDTAAAAIDAFVTKLNASGSALLYSTFLGGGNSDNGGAIAVDSGGMAYVGGDTMSTTNFPTTAGAFDTTGNGTGFDGFVTKLNSAGSALVYSTYLGGAAGNDTVTSIALDSGTAATVSGQTGSNNFPTTAGAFDTSFNGGPNDAFVSELNPTGTGLNFSTYLGGIGDELQADIALDSAGNTYFGGGTTSNDFPATPGAFDPLDNPGNEVVVTKLNPTGTGVVYSTFIGSGGSDLAHDIAVDNAGNAYITGSTTSSSYPVSTGAFDESHNGGADVFVSRLNAAGSALTHSTFLGSNVTETGRGIAVDGSANAYITGDTAGTTFPTTAGAADTTHNGATDTIVAKLNMTPAAQPGYVRPQSASSLRLSLVPAFVACTAPDRVHGPPDLPGGTNPDGSCNPPVHQSAFVTVGAPDANGKVVNSVGSLALKTAAGNLATAIDEADLIVEANITDVRNTSGLTDYTGQLRVELDLRITDRFNGATNTETGTQQNIKFFVPLTCSPTGGPADIGSDCSASTTADAITPSVVREGIRSVWDLGQVVVQDGGADGDPGTQPNGFFARQGVLVP